MLRSKKYFLAKWIWNLLLRLKKSHIHFKNFFLRAKMVLEKLFSLQQKKFQEEPSYPEHDNSFPKRGENPEFAASFYKYLIIKLLCSWKIFYATDYRLCLAKVEVLKFLAFLAAWFRDNRWERSTSLVGLRLTPLDETLVSKYKSGGEIWTSSVNVQTFRQWMSWGFPVYGGPLLERQVWIYIACFVKKNLV